jgi:hypothetical protein
MHAIPALPLALCVAALGQAAAQPATPAETEIWEPVPPVVTPGAPLASAPPGDAIVVEKSAGNIATRRRFRDYQLHIEWRVPEGIAGDGQARGNSGVFLASTGERDRGYELQILDSYGNATYVNGMAGSLYKQSPPLVNPSRKPGEWQSYDVIWTAPRFHANGSLAAPARATVFFNGVLVQKDFVLRGETVFVGAPAYWPHGDSPIKLQAHQDPSAPLAFRNIWVRPLER